MTADPPAEEGAARGRLARMGGGLRLRTSVAAAVVVGVALSVAGAGLLVVLQRDLVAGVRHSALIRASDVATALQNGTPVGSVVRQVAGGSSVQVLDARGTVLAAGAELAGRPALSGLRPGAAQVLSTTTDQNVAGEDGNRSVVVALGVATAGGHLLDVQVAAALDQVDESLGTVRRGLLVGLPALVAVVALTTWVVVGWALAPVDRIRRQVDAVAGLAVRTVLETPVGTDEIARLAATMNRMLARLHAAGERQHRFVADASHELRAPIATIRAQLEVTAAHPGQPPDAAAAEAMLSEALRMQQLVTDLLVLAGIDEGRRGSVTDVDLDDLLAGEAARLRSRGLVRVETGGITPVRTVGHPGQLGRVLRNLVDNAERHARSTVRLHCAQVGASARVLVSDDGAGIAVADRERIFDRFTRLDAARARDDGGSGLGLAIARELARLHGGDVTLLAGDGAATTFCLTLPAPTTPVRPDEAGQPLAHG